MEVRSFSGSQIMSQVTNLNAESIRLDADAIYIERVLRARETLPGQKMVDGIRLFERACGLMRDGVRHQFPDATPD
ncbi:MAG: hypothetical protein FJ267_09835, partial [Planctomycetes bacterium]|nr:hypothetical protein [Planctomycetota bacterium]